MAYKNLRCRALAVGAVLSLGVCLPLQSVVYAQEDSHSQTPELANAVSEAVAGTPSSGGEIASVKSGDGFAAQSDDFKVGIPENSSDSITVTKESIGGVEKAVAIGVGGEGGQVGELAPDGSVVYNGESGVSQTVQATEGGVRIHNIIQSDQAPTEFVHKLDLPNGARLVKASELELSGEDAENATVELQENQGAANEGIDPILIVDQDDKLIAGFGEAWAKDASGADVLTSYEIRDGALVQKVDHQLQDVQYPVVADPYLFIDLVKSANWVEHDEGWTLEVVPTGWARAHSFSRPSISYLVGSLGWDELYDKYKDEGRGIKTNLGGMRDQWICHQQLVGVRAPRKETWNLDEWRPDVGYIETVNTQCNPGGTRFFD